MGKGDRVLNCLQKGSRVAPLSHSIFHSNLSNLKHVFKRSIWREAFSKTLIGGIFSF